MKYKNHDSTKRPEVRFLGQTDSGCISQCSCCGELQLEFGNIAFCTNPEELAQFYKFLFYLEPNPSGIYKSNRNEYHFSFQKSRIQMGLSQSEHGELCALMKNALDNIG